ncbi:MAG: DUF1343 domain-containing protein [Puniceicoccales bacterium]|jgi:uncharacterized protein YbbC (DUF1343 family)|nr:DUF1343 domain-containing protein [Puniceicoccales bacterium]
MFFREYCKGNKLQLGIDVLQEKKFVVLKKKKVALLTNTSATDSKGKLTLDVFVESKDVQLKALLLPEHNGGFDDKKLEELKKKGIDVHYTHTPTGRSPLVEWFKNIDVVVADIQDIGIRYYTHSSSVLYAMIKAFEASKEFIILDRPNPLGSYIGGPIMDKKYLSFLGPIPGEPLFHGMTIGEKANWIKNRGETFEVKCNCGMKDCAHGIFCNTTTFKKGTLTIVKVKGWNRKKILSQTGSYTLDSQINLSPWIKNVASIFDYAALSFAVLLASSSINFIDTHKNPKFPERNFKTFASPYVKSSEILNFLQKQCPNALVGYALTPIKIEKITAGKTELLDGLDLTIKNFSQTTPALLSLTLFALAQEWVPDCDWETFEKSLTNAAQTMVTSTPNAVVQNNKTSPIRDLKKLTLAQQKSLRKAKWDRLPKLQRELFSKHIGNSELINKLFNGESIDVTYFRNKWDREATSFYNETKKYYLY